MSDTIGLSVFKVNELECVLRSGKPESMVQTRMVLLGFSDKRGMDGVDRCERCSAS